MFPTPNAHNDAKFLGCPGRTAESSIFRLRLGPRRRPKRLESQRVASLQKTDGLTGKNPYSTPLVWEFSPPNQLPWLKNPSFCWGGFGFCRYPKGFYKAVILEDSAAPQRLPRKSWQITQIARDGCFRFGENPWKKINENLLPNAASCEREIYHVFFRIRYSAITLTKQTDVATLGINSSHLW